MSSKIVITMLITIISMIITIMLHSTSLSSTVVVADPASPKPIVMNLIHVDSIHSPFFNPNSTIEQLATDALERSMFRLMSFNAEEVPNFIRIPIRETAQIPGVFFAQLQVGKPALDQLVVVDTGSKFPWLFCTPLGSNNSRFYDHLKSSTYYPVNCDDEHCMGGETPEPICFHGSPSFYEDRWGNFGVLVKDAISFSGYPDYSKMTLFGCAISLENRNSYGGILGLGYGNISVISQWGYKEFSYCFKSVSNVDGETSSGVLLLGYDDLLSGGYETTLDIIGSHYYVTIEGIQVATGYDLPLNKSLSVILDSGSSVTYFPLEIVVMIENYVVKMMGEYLHRVLNPDNRLCYLASLTDIRDMIPFPLLTLKFSNDVLFEIVPENAFRQIADEVVCLAILPTTIEDLNIIGAIAQQHFAFTYDLEEELLRFQYFDCDRLRP